jgi:hypothetical protein
MNYCPRRLWTEAKKYCLQDYKTTKTPPVDAIPPIIVDTFCSVIMCIAYSYGFARNMNVGNITKLGLLTKKPITCFSTTVIQNGEAI